jgi:type IV pilus assembly protein PilC
MGFSDLVVQNFVLVLMVALVMILLVRGWIVRKREQFHRIVLELPWLGPTVRKFATSQLARTLATLLGGGIPLVNALEIAGRAMSNRFMAREIDEVGRRVREGEGFAKALLARQVFPDVAVKMVEVGEQTGALTEMLNSLAEFYDEEIETEVGRYITLIEPMMLVLMGVVIAVVVLALYMPLFELSSVMK